MGIDMQLHYEEMIRTQLKEKSSEATCQAFDHLVALGYDPDRIITTLAFRRGANVIMEDEEEKELEESQWHDRINELIEKQPDEDAEQVTDYQMKKIASRVKREFGYIQHGNEDIDLIGLAAYENHLMDLAKDFDFNSRQLKTVAEIWMFLLYGSYHSITYEFEDVADQIIIETAKYMSYYTNPIIAGKLKDIEVKDPEQLFESFKSVLMRLGRIHESMEFWEKELGSNGYIKYLSQFL